LDIPPYAHWEEKSMRVKTSDDKDVVIQQKGNVTNYQREG